MFHTRQGVSRLHFPTPRAYRMNGNIISRYLSDFDIKIIPWGKGVYVLPNMVHAVGKYEKQTRSVKTDGNIAQIGGTTDLCDASVDLSNHLLAVHKPSGILSHPNVDKDIAKSIIQAPYDMKEEAFLVESVDINDSNTKTTRVWLINRLDSATSGLLLLSTNQLVTKYMKDLFKRRLVKKIYIAKVFGRFEGKGCVWEDQLTISKTNQIVRTSDGSNTGNTRNQNQKIARCKVEKYKSTSKTLGPDTSLLQLNPSTGYSHQLRFQCAKHNFPIVGDQVYGNFDLNKLCERNNPLSMKQSGVLHLHSHSISFDYSFQGQTFNYKAVSNVTWPM